MGLDQCYKTLRDASAKHQRWKKETENKLGLSWAKLRSAFSLAWNLVFFCTQFIIVIICLTYILEEEIKLFKPSKLNHVDQNLNKDDQINRSNQVAQFTFIRLS